MSGRASDGLYALAISMVIFFLDHQELNDEDGT